MDTTETGAFLELTEGLQVGGGRQIMWAPASYPSDINLSLVGVNFNGIIFTEDTMPEEVMRQASAIIIAAPNDGESYSLSFEGYFGPGQLVHIGVMGLPTYDPFQLVLGTPTEFNVGANNYFTAPFLVTFTDVGQTATVVGIHNRKNSLFGKQNAVIGTTSADPTVAPPPYTFGAP
jgi:hypothetical protein